MRYELATDAQASDLVDYIARRAREETSTIVFERERVNRVRLTALPWPQRARMRARAWRISRRYR